MVTNRFRFFRKPFIIFSLITLMLLIGAANEQHARMDVIDRTAGTDQVALNQIVHSVPAQHVHSYVINGKKTLLATNRGLLVYDGLAYHQLLEEETFAIATRDDGQRLLAGTRTGMMISDDGGKNWRTSNQGLPKGLVPLAIELTNSSNRLYLGTDRHGVYRSDDGGNSWRATIKGLPPSIGAAPFAVINRVYAAPNNSNLVFAATDAHGIYFSRDGGENWQETAMKLPGLFYHRVNAPFISFDPTSNAIYALINFPVHSHLIEHFIYRSFDNGEQWTLLGKLEPNQQIDDFKVQSANITIRNEKGVSSIDLDRVKSTETVLSEPWPAAPVSGTEADFDDNNIAVLHDDQSFINVSVGDLNNTGANIARRFYQRHGDDYDIIVTFLDPLYVFSYARGGLAYNTIVSNNVAGIGLQVGTFNNGPLFYGSRNARLRSFCNLNNISNYPDDFNQSFFITNSAIDVVSHEVGHTWGAYLYFDDNGVTSNELLGSQLSHWNFFFNSNASYLEGNGYTDKGDGTFLINSATSRYNDFDQYAMGLKSSASPTFIVSSPTKIDPGIAGEDGQAVDPASDFARTLPPLAPPDFPAITVTGTRKNVTLNNVIAVEGPRQTSDVVGDGRLKIAFVYATPAGQEPFQEGFDRVKRLRDAFLNNFKTATGGLVNIDSTLLAKGGSDTTPPTLKVLTPNGSESFQAGTIMTISWQSHDENGIAKHDILLSLDGGATYPITVATLVNGKNQSFDYTIPAAIISNTARIKVIATDYAGNKTEDTSDNIFFVQKETTAPIVKVQYPNGGEQLTAGKPIVVSWSSSDNGTIQSQDVKASLDGGKTFDITIVAGLDGNIQNFTWRIPAELASNNVLIQVTAKDTAGNIGSDVSDKTFRIGQPDVTPPQVQLLSPIGGEKLQAKGTFTISWNSSDNDQLASHALALSTDGGHNFDITIANGLSGSSQNFVWTVPDLEITNARVRITATDAQRNIASSTSISDFSISRQDVTAPIVKVITPNGGEQLRGGDQLSISWQSSDNIGVQSQAINLSLDGGKTFSVKVIDGLPGNAASFTFLIPDSLQATNARIQVVAVDVNGNIGQDISDNGFSIEAKDTLAPTVKILSPNGGEVFAGSDPLQISWQSLDNIAVVAHDVQISLDGGANYTTVQSGLAGNIQQTVVDVSKLLSERVKVKIIAHDANNNIGADESDASFVITTRPTISNAQYNDNGKKLSVFATGVSTSTSIEINGQTISTKAKFKANKGVLVFKGSRTQLNLRSGENTVVIKERGLASVSFKFNIS